MFFPSGYRRDIKYGQPDPPAQILRTESLKAWHSGRIRFVVTCPEALAEKVPATESVERSCLTLKVGQDIPVRQVRERLLELGFRQVDYVYEPGQFALRGSILDVYSYACPAPYRIDFFDTEVDSIRNFDVETQLSTETPSEVTILPDMGELEEDGGVPLPEFAGPETVWLCRDPKHLMARIEAIASSTLAAQVDITGEGDADAMLKVVRPDAFRSLFEASRRVVFTPKATRKART